MFSFISTNSPLKEFPIKKIKKIPVNLQMENWERKRLLTLTSFAGFAGPLPPSSAITRFLQWSMEKAVGASEHFALNWEKGWATCQCSQPSTCWDFPRSLTLSQPVPGALLHTEADSDLASSWASHHIFPTLKHTPRQFPGSEGHGHLNSQHRLGPVERYQRCP